MTYDLHPLCTLFPRMEGSEFKSLCSDIKANGLRTPIVLHDGMILDGGNRYRACLAANVEPQFSAFTGGNMVAFVLSSNLHRRHMSMGQQAAIVASATNWAEAQTVGKPKSGNVAGLHSTVAARAAQSGASDRTQRTADKVAKADPGLAVAVGQGKTTLAKAAETIEPAKPRPAATPLRQQDAATTPDEPSDLDLVVAELEAAHAEIQVLQGLVTAIEATDPRAEALKWRRAYDDAVRKQSEAMERTKLATDREAWTMRQLRRCGKAVSEDDPSKIAPTVEALARGRVAA